MVPGKTKKRFPGQHCWLLAIETDILKPELMLLNLKPEYRKIGLKLLVMRLMGFVSGLKTGLTGNNR